MKLLFKLELSRCNLYYFSEVLPFGKSLFRFIGNVGWAYLFKQFIQFLEENVLIFNEGKLVDASFTIAPRQRNTREENEKIKKGEGADLRVDQPNKKKHEDTDARWTKKNGEKYYGS